MATSAEEIFRKSFPLMGSPVTGEREAALHQVYGVMQRLSPPRTFLDLLDALENNVPKAAYEELADKLRQAEQRADDADAKSAKLARQLTTAYALLWMQSNWKRWVGAAVVLAAVAGGGVWYERVAGAAQRVAVETALRGNLAGDKWGLGYSRPIIETVAGKPYWTILWGGIDRQHADEQGRPVTLHCLHLYAAPATAKSGVYRKPEPFGTLGQLHWPERASLCRLAPDEEASK